MTIIITTVSGRSSETICRFRSPVRASSQLCE